ncbi:hypothetical protein shim_39030 [Shimia sp. SK013]|uniref:DUF3306 domain-containing protein n=1 Tax=Shimia sp. SK013 TaxID=1389006 RepID=UPI0006B666ED|nr:DUF3306 domain-containing protein [Shimia sp. SK013]KPA19944.1 hypothetical protein shim_39030 [Shimia sp. SK013]
MNGGGDFWARRKAAVAAEAEAESRAEVQAVEAEEQAALEEKPDAEILAELELRDPDDMQAGDDFSAFLTKAVPERLRRRALRKLWLTNPTLANVDGLVDYGEDFTDGAMVVEGLQTAYQVGKGMLKHVEEMARKAAEADADLQDTSGEGEPEEEILELAGAEPEIVPIEPTFVDQNEEFELEEVAPTARRRMRFEFADAAPAMESQ